MNEDFDKYYAADLHVIEGGNVDDPDDPGGRTGQGVTQRKYNAWRRSKGLPLQDVYKISPAEWSEIMKTQFWDACRCDDMRPGVDICVADGSVHSGPVQSIKWLQAALGVRVDGMLGVSTMAALNAYSDDDVLIAKICALRLDFMRHLKTWPKYKGGWTARVAHIKVKSQSIAMGSVGPTPSWVEGMNRKANIEDAVAAPPKAIGDTIGTGGIVSVALTQAQTALSPASTWEPIAHVLTGIAVIGGVCTVLGYAWSAYARHKEGLRATALQLDTTLPTNTTTTEVVDSPPVATMPVTAAPVVAPTAPAVTAPLPTPVSSLPPIASGYLTGQVPPNTVLMNAESGNVGLGGTPVGST